MIREVVLTARASEQLDAACQWYAERSSDLAAAWYDGFIGALVSLEENPRRFGLARENDSFPFEMRELLYGVGKRKTHRALFTVRRDRVVVYAIRHTAQRDVAPDDV